MNLLWWLALLSFKQNVLVSGGFSSSATKIAQIWETLEWKNVTIYSAHIGGPSTVGVMKETGKLGKTMLQFRPLEDLRLLTPLHEYKGGIPLAHHAVAIFFDDWRGNHELVDLVTSTVIGHRHDLVLVVTDDLREAELYWRNVDFNVAFYAASLSETGVLVERVMLQKNGQNVLRTPIAGKGEREQSLSSGHGQNLEFNVIPFKPQIQIKYAEDGAESDGSSKFEGIVVDYLDIMSRHSNFSYSLILEESGDFGTLPSGHQTLSNSSGMLRSLIGGDFASSAAIWTQSEGRARWLHYATTLMPTTMNCFVSTRFLSQRHDRWFLARPFTAGAWSLILAVVALAGLCYLTFGDRKFRRILAAVMGLFFVIVNAYYSGALVMDLISSRYGITGAKLCNITQGKQGSSTFILQESPLRQPSGRTLALPGMEDADHGRPPEHHQQQLRPAEPRVSKDGPAAEEPTDAGRTRKGLNRGSPGSLVQL